MNIETKDPEQAKKDGYRPLTIGYDLPKEIDMLNGVISDMEASGTDYELVKGEQGVEVWRRAPLAEKNKEGNETV